MVRGCFAASGPVQLDIIDGKMNSQVYHDILQDNVRHMLKTRDLGMCPCVENETQTNCELVVSVCSNS
jgi:hypothetical protein